MRVPPGFCVTTGAFRRSVTTVLADRLDRLSGLDAGDRRSIRVLSAELRDAIEAVVLGDDLAAAVTAELDRLGAHWRLRRAIERHLGGSAHHLVRGPA